MLPAMSVPMPATATMPIVHAMDAGTGTGTGASIPGASLRSPPRAQDVPVGGHRVDANAAAHVTASHQRPIQTAARKALGVVSRAPRASGAPVRHQPRHGPVHVRSHPCTARCGDRRATRRASVSTPPAAHTPRRLPRASRARQLPPSLDHHRNAHPTAWKPSRIHTIRTMVPVASCLRPGALTCAIAAIRRHRPPGKDRTLFGRSRVTTVLRFQIPKRGQWLGRNTIRVFMGHGGGWQEYPILRAGGWKTRQTDRSG